MKPNRDGEGRGRRGKARRTAREATEAEAVGGLRWREAVLRMKKRMHGQDVKGCHNRNWNGEEG